MPHPRLRMSIVCGSGRAAGCGKPGGADATPPFDIELGVGLWGGGGGREAWGGGVRGRLEG